MIHYIVGVAKQHGDSVYIISAGGFGIRVHYTGSQKKGEWYVHPIIDDNHKTIIYYAFDTSDQLGVFQLLAKISGIGPKIAHILSSASEDALYEAVNAMDVKFFQSYPGIGPKLAKRIIVELKEELTAKDISALTIDRALYRDIVQTLTNLGYKTIKIDAILEKCPHELTKKNLGDIMKFVITQLH